MADLDIVGLGMATLDVLVRLQDMPTWERTSPISAFGLDGGGPAGTACAAAARLGARAGFIGMAGSDEAAQLKVRSLTESGVDTSRLVVREGPESQVIVVYIQQETGERVFAGLQGLRTEQLRPEELDRDYITSAAYLHLDGFHSKAALQAARWMREAGKKVSFDGSRTDGRPLRGSTPALIPYVDVLICGSGFGQSLTGYTDPWQAGEAMLKLGPSIVVQTDGAAGSYTVTAEERFHTPAFCIDVLDTTGAGDVFHGAYLVGLLHGWPLAAVARFATAVSAIKCTRLGGRRGIPDMAEVMAFLGERGGLGSVSGD